MRRHEHVWFCCNAACARHKMQELVSQIGGIAKGNYTEFTVKIPGYRWRYIFTAETEPERIYGSIIDSWDNCGRARLHPSAIEYVKSHLGREPK